MRHENLSFVQKRCRRASLDYRTESCHTFKRVLPCCVIDFCGLFMLSIILGLHR